MSNGPLVVFKSTPDMWAKEFSGAKPNTERLMSDSEFTTRLAEVDRALHDGKEATICIANTGHLAAVFFRRLTDITVVGSLLGQSLIVLSWEHEIGYGDYTPEDES